MPKYELHQTFDSKVTNFPDDVYPLREGDHLTKLLKVLLEDPGVGQLLKIQTVARLSEALRTTNFSDLDIFFGEMLGLYRLPEEMYRGNPFAGQYTLDEWDEIFSKDSRYKERIRMFLSALNNMGTADSVAMAAEAGCGVRCLVFEGWRYSDNLGLKERVGRYDDSGKLNEVIIIPQAPITQVQRRSTYNAVRQVLPANVFCTVDEQADDAIEIVSIKYVVAASEYFEIRKYVKGQDVIDSEGRYFWIKSGEEVEAPSFAHLTAMETQWSLNENVKDVESLKIEAGQTKVQPGRRTSDSQRFGPWREFKRVDSPDNYPGGKYPGDNAKYNDDGEYVFAWDSQQEYENWIKNHVEKIGGQVRGNEFRLPRSLEFKGGTPSVPEDALAPIDVKVESLYYVR